MVQHPGSRCGLLPTRGLSPRGVLPRAAGALLAPTLLAAPPAAGLQPEEINYYRYILDIEAPESPALVTLDAFPTHAFRASSPKPVGANVHLLFDDDGEVSPAAAIEVAPYFLAGGGVRTLQGYRSSSVGGRLSRVLTKTIVSVGAMRDLTDPEALRAAVALRATLHDTHDPIGNTDLPERVAEALARLADGPPPIEEEELGGRDPEVEAEVEALLAGAARRMRARRDWLVSAGWGLAATLRDAVVAADSIDTVRHTLWLNWQYTLGPRYDVLVTGRALDLFDDDTELRLAAGLQRKTGTADYLAELFFDTTDDRVHGGLAAEAHLAPGVRGIVSLTTEPHLEEGEALRRLEVRALLRWYMAQGD